MEPLFWPKADQVPVRNLRRQFNHGQLFWREAGRGTAVIFVHGSWCDGDQWRAILPILGQSYHCLAPDLIGVGESQRLQDVSDYSIAMQVNILAELVETLRLGSVVLIGHSLGAWVAACYTLRYPDRVRGLCVLEPEGVAYDPKRWQRERWLMSPLGRLWMAILKPFARRNPKSRKPSSWSKNHHLQQRLKRYPTACRLLFRRRRKDIESDLLGSQLAALDLPLVVLQAEGASASSRQLVQTFVMATANAVVKVLPGTDELSSAGEVSAIAEFLKHWLPTL